MKKVKDQTPKTEVNETPKAKGKGTSKKSTRTPKVEKPVVEAPVVEAPVLTFAEAWKLPVTTGVALASKLAGKTPMVNDGLGRLPIAYTVESRDANPRGTDVSKLTPNKMTEKQYTNFTSIAQFGVSEPLGVIISDRVEHVALLSEEARKQQLKDFGFNFALLIASGNFRHRAISLHCGVDKTAFKGSGVLGETDMLKISVPFTIWNDKEELTYLQMIGRASLTNTQQEMSSREFRFIVEAAIKGNKNGASDATLAKSLNMTKQTFSVLRMQVNFTGLNKWLADKVTGAIGVTINTFKEVQNYFGSEASQELKASTKGKISTDDVRELRDTKFQAAINRFNSFMEDANRTMMVDGKPVNVREYLRGKATKCFTKEQVAAILGISLGKPEKVEASAKDFGLVIPTAAIIKAEEKLEGNGADNKPPVLDGDGSGAGEGNGDGLSGLVPPMTPEEESQFTGQTRKVRKSSIEFYCMLNLLVEADFITNEQQTVLASIYQGTASAKGAEQIVASNIEKFTPILDLSPDQVTFANTHGWLAPTVAMENHVKNQAPHLLTVLEANKKEAAIEEADVVGEDE